MLKYDSRPRPKIGLLLLLAVLPLLLPAQTLPDTSDTQSAGHEAYDTLPPLAHDYRWISYRGKADIADTGGVRSCSFYYVNRVDSILYLNINALGIEVMRIVCTPDTVTYVNMLTYQYYKGSYAPLHRILKKPVGLQTLQDIFNGNGEEALANTGFACSYHDYAAMDSTRAFFTTLRLQDLDRLIEITARIKVVRFNIPGPTGIRIPKKFKQLSF
jgi:hypothetical protein